MFVCPHCNEHWTDDEGGYTCHKCGETEAIHSLDCERCFQDFECEEGSLPICDSCLTKIYSNINNALALSEYEAEESDNQSTVNGFYLWLLGSEGINKILYDYCKEHADVEDIMQFFTQGDICVVEDWLKKGEYV